MITLPIGQNTFQRLNIYVVFFKAIKVLDRNIPDCLYNLGVGEHFSKPVSGKRKEKYLTAFMSWSQKVP